MHSSVGAGGTAFLQEKSADLKTRVNKFRETRGGAPKCASLVSD
jgi:hypothetical protein